MSHLADVWANQNPEYGAAIPIIVQTVIWLGFGLELMLITAVAGTAAYRQPDGFYQKDWDGKNPKANPSQPRDEDIFQVNPLSNGNGATR
jgi:hypothetical protein